MSSVDFVEININTIGMVIEILIDIKNNLITINKDQKRISNEKIDELFRIIRLWKESYESSKIIDGEKFVIRIISGNTVDVIKGNGSYPDNYIEFKNWIGNIYE